MDKTKLIAVLGDLEVKAIRWSTKSYVCGSHDTEETTREMKQADTDFSNSLSDLRKTILSEGVTE
jgi:hypothetical protein